MIMKSRNGSAPLRSVAENAPANECGYGVAHIHPVVQGVPEQVPGRRGVMVVREVVVGGVRLAYEVHGERGDAVLLLGDSGMPGIAWEIAHVPALLRAGLMPVTVDCCGTGASESPPGPYTIPLLAQDIAALIEHLDLGPVHAVGLTQGGFIAEQLAVARPDLLRSMTLIASAGPTTAYHRIRLRAWQDLLEAGHRLPDELFIADRLVHGLPMSLLQDSDEDIEKWITTFSLRTYQESVGLQEQHAACRAWLLDSERGAHWPSIRTRCLLIAFQHDLLFPPSAARCCAARIRGAELVGMPGAGSADGFLDTADKISAIIARFIQRPHGTPGGW